MAAPAAAAGFGLKSVFDFVVNVKNSSALQKLAGSVLNFRGSLSGLGVTIIFVDRLIQSFTRAWQRLNYVIGVTKLSEVAADFRKISEFTGVGVERLQAFAIAGERVGMTMEDVQDVFATLGEKIRDMQTEKGVQEDFARFGIGKDFFANTKDILESTERFIDHWVKQSPLDRLALGETILGGDNAKKLSKMAEGGLAGLRAAMKEAMASGRVLTEEQIQVAKRFADSQRVFLATIQAVQHQVALVLMPLLTRMFDLFQMITKHVLDFLRIIAPDVLEFLSSSLDKQLQRVKIWLEWFDANIKPIGETVTRLIYGAMAAMGALAGLGNFKLVPFVTALAAGFGVLVLIVDDVLTYLRGGVSLIEELLDSSPVAKEAVADFSEAWGNLRIATLLFMDALRIFVQGPMLPTMIALIAHFAKGITSTGVVVVFAVNAMVRVFSTLLDILIRVGAAMDLATLGYASSILGAPLGGGASPSDRYAMAKYAGTNPLGGSVFNPFTGQGGIQEQMWGPVGSHVINHGATNINAPSNVTVNSSQPWNTAARIMKRSVERGMQPPE